MQRDTRAGRPIRVRGHLKAGDEVDPLAVCGSVPGLIDPSDISTAGALCSRIAASVPTGGLSHATTAISPAMLFAFRCRSMLSFTSSRPINEKRIPGVPFSCPSETPIVYAGAISRTARSSLRTRSDSAALDGRDLPEYADVALAVTKTPRNSPHGIMDLRHVLAEEARGAHQLDVPAGVRGLKAVTAHGRAF